MTIGLWNLRTLASRTLHHLSRVALAVPILTTFSRLITGTVVTSLGIMTITHAGTMYLREIVWNDLTVRVQKINPTSSDTSAGGSNSGLDDVQLHLHWMQHAFEVGDNMEITFGMHKGKSRVLSELTAKTVTVLGTDLSHVSSIVIQC